MMPIRRYAFTDGGNGCPPDYDRLLRSMDDRELADEIDSGRGTPDYRAALIQEHARRERRNA